MSGPAVRRYRCSAAARWLPRVVAAAVLVAATLAGYRIDPRVRQTGWRYVRYFVVLSGAVLALATVRKGAEVRTVVRVEPDGLTFAHGRREATLPFEEIRALEYAPPLSASRHWLPAAVLVDRWGKSWRLSALLADGDGLIEELLRRTGRSDLRSWAEVLRLRQRLGRAPRLLALAYASAALTLLLAWLFLASGPFDAP